MHMSRTLLCLHCVTLCSSAEHCVSTLCDIIMRCVYAHVQDVAVSSLCDIMSQHCVRLYAETAGCDFSK